ncbi:MAG: type I-MYXAN CRISPR-associated protein Cas6/Cmx6 [Polaromonas sp.]|uniref:type I-MYXAN CRISPR-associated protein Cas6/Cmx6 n=1 Tax=Polaromonas sp. TaxID=1869339 RepID=UPI0027181951|nr:type I-MYXAN CRISPR-associated protein Cas6/Cmx6 [Polaromonas sp.]MDO9112609.1 type I-MYXAN CRISPR-associated protein Cas6/Cmx6 [Polaromonas sp.]MDP1887250.1 type I-MYXAN CRISPR-associated protein Cas6/Cmx6 [Polaromonas sp.]
MSTPQAPDKAAVDAAFPIQGQTLPRDHAQALQQGLCAQFPWLDTDPVAGIHPLKVVQGSDEQALLSRRTCLLLRVGAERADELLALAGLDLTVGAHLLRLGRPHLRELLPHSTLYAYRVAAGSADEMTFMAAVDRELAELAIGGERVCGKRQRVLASGRVLDTFSLMLHALPPEQSLRLQQHGLGPHRLLGCGIFVPHRSAAAV